MGTIHNLECILCSRTFAEKAGLYTCPLCGSEGALIVHYNYNSLKKKFNAETLKKNTDYSMWRYLPILPVTSLKSIPVQRIGWTPLYDSTRLAKEIGVKSIFIKDDSMNPTASLKDRASSIAVARAIQEKMEIITCSSTGNAATSLAGLSASRGLSSFIFVPYTAPEAKVTQLKIYGANVFLIKGKYEDAFALSMRCSSEYKWYNRNSGINPYMIEGKKTVALEIAEQLGFEPPDMVFVAVGDGCTLAGVHKGFRDLQKLGMLKKIPQLIGVQAKGADPIRQAWQNQKPMVPQKTETIADSIAVGTPRSWRRAIKAVEETNGFYIGVSDMEIITAMKVLGATCGIFGEPAGVTGFAGVLKAKRKNLIPKNHSVGIIITGNGLKDIPSAQRAYETSIQIPPNFQKLREIIKKIQTHNS